MRFSALFTSFAVAAVLSGCGVVHQDVTRSNADSLSIVQTSDAALVLDRAVSLNLMANQLAQYSIVPSGAEQPTELVSASALVQSVRDMNGQMRAVQQGLPELLAQQDAEMAALKFRRATGAVSRKRYEQDMSAIRDSRATIVQALARTVKQTQQARQNVEAAMQQGQSGLDWHLSATSQLAREADLARATISQLEVVTSKPNDRAAFTVAPRSGELR